jgi:hypothetical protein
VAGSILVHFTFLLKGVPERFPIGTFPPCNTPQAANRLFLHFRRLPSRELVGEILAPLQKAPAP